MTIDSSRTPLPRIPTGIPNMDAVVGGGLPRGVCTIVAGPPGAGKTILAQQVCFHNATPESPALYFNTLSEPTAKTLLYLQQFKFFDPRKLEDAVRFIDLGVILRTKGLDKATGLILEHMRQVRPSLVVLDSFKVFDDLAKSPEELRKFSYEIAVNLMAWECTAFLLGEYGEDDHRTNPTFSVVDGLITLDQRLISGEQQRFLRVVKMRGTDQSRDEHPFLITDAGIELYTPRVSIRRERAADKRNAELPRRRTGISRLDDLIVEGIPVGSSVLVAGTAGTGKTILSLEFIYRGAKELGEKGIVFSFEETEERLRAAARGLGWDLDGEIERGMIEIVFIPQPDILVERHLLFMRQRIAALGAKRVVVDSMSVFLYKITDPQAARDKVYQLATVIKTAEAIGFFGASIPYGSARLSRFGVEETVVDGVILLTLDEDRLERQRFIEIYKLRNTAHSGGKHGMEIGPGGIRIFPRPLGRGRPTPAEPETETPRDRRRHKTRVRGLDPLLGGGVFEGSTTLVSGAAGIGKSTIGLQFVLEGARSGEPGLLVSLDQTPAEVVRTAESMGLKLAKAVESGQVQVVNFAEHRLRAARFVAELEDLIAAQGTRRLVFDSMSPLIHGGQPTEEVRKLFASLVSRLRALGVTSVFTLKSRFLVRRSGTISDAGLSTSADNVLILKYARAGNRLEHRIAVVKTRGSAHDRRFHEVELGLGGLRVGDPVGEPVKVKKRGR